MDNESGNWKYTFSGFDPEKERNQEAICTVGNGYVSVRGAMEGSVSSSTFSPGTYITGLYNRIPSEVSGRTIYNEDFVCCPDWCFIRFKPEGGKWFDPENTKVLGSEKVIDFKNGILYRKTEVKDQEDRITRIKTLRFVSMNRENAAYIKYTLTPVNYSENIAIRSGLKGDIINSGVKRYSQLNQYHMEPLKEHSEGNSTLLLVKTTESKRVVAESALHFITIDNSLIEPEWVNATAKRYAEVQTSIACKKGEEISLEKRCIIDVDPVGESKISKKDILDQNRALPCFEDMKLKSVKEWDKIWNRADIEIKGDKETERIARLHTYHLCVTSSFNTMGKDVSVPARGLHGEAYRGHIFWDEIYVMPFYMRNFPEIASSLLMYRVNRLQPAREYAKEYGYRGAMYPWQSGSKGTEETQTIHLNPNSGEWGPDYSSLQRHISIAVAYNIWNYYHYTADVKFLENHGLEVLLEIARFWISKTEYSAEKDRYVINKVMGPNEFHEKYPGSDDGGLNNNAYTNIMAFWVIDRCFEALSIVTAETADEIKTKISLTDDELHEWRDIIAKIYIPVLENGIIDQYEGFCDLKEITDDMYKEYKEKYGNIQRMDRILKAEGLSPDDYQISKQADLLMIFYLLPVDTVKDIFRKCGYDLTDKMIHDNYEYYLNRTSHGSTLSFVVHSYLALLFNDIERSDDWFSKSLTADVSDIQGGTVKEGIHTGLMAGTIDLVISSFAGLDLSGKHPEFIPKLKPNWERIRFSFFFRGINYLVSIDSQEFHIKPLNEGGNFIISVNRKKYEVKGDHWKKIDL